MMKMKYGMRTPFLKDKPSGMILWLLLQDAAKALSEIKCAELPVIITIQSSQPNTIEWLSFIDEVDDEGISNPKEPKL